MPVKELKGKVPYTNSSSTSIPWFCPGTNRPVFEAHSQNCREHDTVIEAYEQSIMEHGILQDVRGRLFAALSLAPSADDPSIYEEGLPLRLITWGSLGRAFYSAHSKAGAANKQIAASLANGLEGICVLRARLPADCVSYLRDYHNLWHDGAGDNFIKLLRDSREVAAAWEAHVSLVNPARSGFATWLQEVPEEVR